MSLELADLPSSLKAVQRGPPFFKIDDDILTIIISFLYVQDILVLRQVCKSLSNKTRLRSVWSTAIMVHVIPKDLPWPTYAWPLTGIPSATLEELCLRAIRMVTQWDGGSSKRECHFSRCLQRPWNSVTWMELLRSRWLLLQLDSARLELWDLDRPFDGSPADVFDGLEDKVDGFKALCHRNDHHTVLLSTRSFKTLYLNISLPYIGEILEKPKRFGAGHYVEGCSGLLDANHEITAFSRCGSEEGAIIQSSHSSSIVVLRNGLGDPKLSYAAAVQIRSNVIVVARVQGVDIYSMDTVNDYLRSEQASGRPLSVGPFQSIRYTEGCTGLGASFLDPSCGDWAKLPYCGPDGIYLRVDADCVLIQVIYPQHDHGNPLTFHLSPPVELLYAPADYPGGYPTILSSWGVSARRMVYLNEADEGLVLLGLSVPLGFEAETKVPSLYDRCVAWWRLPNSVQDLARFISFDEWTGISIVAMGSGRIWVADLGTLSNLAPLDEPLRELDFSHPPHPDPAWPLIHPLPWPSNPEKVERTPLEWKRLPQLSCAVEQYFPGKNEADCFGGITWFLNEALHIPGHATVIIFGNPDPDDIPYTSVEIVDTGGRIVVILRHCDVEFYEARLIDQGIPIENVVTHIARSTRLEELPGSRILVDGTARTRYASWRRRCGENGPLCMW